MTTKEETGQEVQTPLLSGAVIQRRYIVESLLGKGDFGTIYLVRDQHKKQELFVLADVYNTNKEESYRFTLEYVAPTSLDHQALPRVQYVFNDDKLDRACVLMRYIEEPTFEILRLQQPYKRFPLSKVMTFMVPVLNALSYLHHQNPPVIHGNINPTNIIVSRALHAPALIMLDLVKECDSTTTTLHCFVPGYGAPEQYEKEISTSTDLYALGATFYTLLTGIIPPDALYRSTQLNNGDVDPLKPLSEVIPTIPTSIVQTIQRSMSLKAANRFLSVQQFEQALIGELRFQESPTLQLNQRLPKQYLSPKEVLVEQKPLEPMIRPTSTTQTNSVKQQSPEPFLVQSVPEILQASEVVPPISVAHKPSVSEGEAPTIADHKLSVPEVVPLPIVSEETPVPEIVSSGSAQSPITMEKAVEIAAESLPRKTRTVLSREPRILRPVSSSQTVEKPAAYVPKHLRAWKFGILLSAFAVLISLGISMLIWSGIPNHPTAHHGTLTTSIKSPTRTTPSVASINPTLTGKYSGTIYDVSAGVSTSMSLTGIRQSQGNISGYLTLGPKMQGSGHFSGTVDTTKELEFTVTAGNVTLFFDGVKESATNLTGNFYRCSSIGLTQGEQCKQVPGSYGIWNIVPLS